MYGVLSVALNIYVALDQGAWTQAGSIRWPDASKRVAVIIEEEGLRAELPGCQLPPSDSSTRWAFRMGEICGRLVVLVDKEARLSESSLAEQFLASHEAFHVAAQMYGSKVPIAFIGIDPELPPRYSRGREFERIYDAIDASTGMSGCDTVRAEYERLAAPERRYLDYKMYWEWPAEYYASEVHFRGNLVAYRQLRATLFSSGDEGQRLFLSGVKIGQVLDDAIGRRAWQREVAEGASMFDLYWERCGWKAPDRGLRVKMTEVHLAK